MTSRVLLATCQSFPDGDDDGPALLAALADRDIRADWRVWDDPDVPWPDADLVLIRSTWDYTSRRPDFLQWAAAVPRLWNPRELVEWNSDKNYLRDLAGHGAAVVPTEWAAPGQAPDLPADGPFVVKPSVGAGSRGVGRFDASAAGAHDAALAHIASLHEAGRTVMVQPYLADVDTAGETALVYFGGRFSHAIRKAPMLAPDAVYAVDQKALYLDEAISARTPSAAELAAGGLVLEALRAWSGAAARARSGATEQPYTAPLYARVDLLPSAEGPVLVELELTEPSLFLGHAEGAADRLAEAVASYAGASHAGASHAGASQARRGTDAGTGA